MLLRLSHICIHWHIHSPCSSHTAPDAPVPRRPEWISRQQFSMAPVSLLHQVLVLPFVPATSCRRSPTCRASLARTWVVLDHGHSISHFQNQVVLLSTLPVRPYGCRGNSPCSTPSAWLHGQGGPVRPDRPISDIFSITWSGEGKFAGLATLDYLCLLAVNQPLMLEPLVSSCSIRLFLTQEPFLRGNIRSSCLFWMDSHRSTHVLHWKTS